MSLAKYGINHFGVHEIVPQSVMEAHEVHRIVQFLDLRWVYAWDWIRRKRGKTIYINTYGLKSRPDWYPVFHNRGLRVGDGFQTSQHFYGRAGDGDEVGTNNDDLWNWIMLPKNQKELLSIGITTIERLEDTPTWIHLDCRNWGYQISEIQIVPAK